MGLYVTKKNSEDKEKEEKETEKEKPVSAYVHNPYALPTPAGDIDDNAESSSGEETEDTGSILNNSNMTTDSESGKKKRKRKKKSIEDNKACDALRFKTRMCKNWELTAKCPYGPRCLFAHGKKELRSYDINNQSIIVAARTRSPCRNFFSMGRFPQFIPIPHELIELGRDGIPFPVTEPVEQLARVPSLDVHTIMDKTETMTA